MIMKLVGDICIHLYIHIALFLFNFIMFLKCFVFIGVQYFLKKFMAKNKSGASRKIYHHVTCATDTANVKIVFDSCKDIILRANLASSGFD